MCSVEDEDLGWAVRCTVFRHQYLVSDVASFIALVSQLIEAWLFTWRRNRRQLTWLAAGRRQHDRISDVQDLLRGAIVCVQLDLGEGGVVFPKLVDHVSPGATPAVDRLVGVAHHGDIARSS